MFAPLRVCVAAAFCLSLGSWATAAEKPPHGQDTPPGPALSPAEAVKKIGEQLKGKDAQEIIDSFVTEDESGKKKVDTKKLLNDLFGR